MSWAGRIGMGGLVISIIFGLVSILWTGFDAIALFTFAATLCILVPFFFRIMKNE